MMHSAHELSSRGVILTLNISIRSGRRSIHFGESHQLHPIKCILIDADILQRVLSTSTATVSTTNGFTQVKTIGVNRTSIRALKLPSHAVQRFGEFSSRQIEFRRQDVGLFQRDGHARSIFSTLAARHSQSFHFTDRRFGQLEYGHVLNLGRRQFLLQLGYDVGQRPPRIAKSCTQIDTNL